VPAPGGGAPPGEVPFGDVVAWLIGAASAGASTGRGRARRAGEDDGVGAAAAPPDDVDHAAAVAAAIAVPLPGVPMATRPPAPMPHDAPAAAGAIDEAPTLLDRPVGGDLTALVPVPAGDIYAAASRRGASPGDDPPPLEDAAPTIARMAGAAGSVLGVPAAPSTTPAAAAGPPPAAGATTPAARATAGGVATSVPPPASPDAEASVPFVAVEAAVSGASAAAPAVPATTARRSASPEGAPAVTHAARPVSRSDVDPGHGPTARADQARSGAVAPEVAAAAALAAAADASVLTPPSISGETAAAPAAGARARRSGAVTPPVLSTSTEGPAASGARAVPPVMPVTDVTALPARLREHVFAAEPVRAEQWPGDAPAPVVLPVGPSGLGRDGAAAAVAVDAPATAGASTLDQALPTQIVRSIRLQWQAGQGEARMQLRPEYLGELTVTIKVDQGAVTATLHAETAEVRRWIETHSASLRDGLAEQGLRLDRLIVADERPRPDASPDRRQRQEDAADDETSRRRRGRPHEPATPFDFPLSDSHERTSA